MYSGVMLSDEGAQVREDRLESTKDIRQVERMKARSPLRGAGARRKSGAKEGIS